MKDESDTSLMEGETKPIQYRVTANNFVVNSTFSFTFRVEDNIVNITNLDANNEFHVHIKDTTFDFTILLQALRVGKTNVEITEIRKLLNSSNMLTVIKAKKLERMEKFSKVLEDRLWYDINNSTITVSVYYSNKMSSN